MTKAEWLKSTDPRPMLRFLTGTNAERVMDVQAFPNCKGSDRKLRLAHFTVALIRRSLKRFPVLS